MLRGWCDWLCVRIRRDPQKLCYPPDQERQAGKQQFDATVSGAVASTAWGQPCEGEVAFPFFLWCPEVLGREIFYPEILGRWTNIIINQFNLVHRLFYWNHSTNKVHWTAAVLIHKEVWIATTCQGNASVEMIKEYIFFP